jgi:long-chain acyl-CoA synthetase
MPFKEQASESWERRNMAVSANSMIVSGDRRVAYPELVRRAQQAARGFHDLGVGPGDAVALFMRNDIAFFEAAFGASFIGAYATPINWHWKADEAGYVLKDCDAEVLVVHADLLPQIESEIPGHVHVFVVETPLEIAAAYGVASEACLVPKGHTHWDDWRDAQEPWTEEPLPNRGNIIYTSGTTGRPKGVRRNPPDATALERLRWVFKNGFYMDLDDPDLRVLMNGPMYHSAPNAYGLMAAREGAYMYLQPRFDPEEMLMLIERERITHMHIVPTMFVRLLKLPEEVKRKYDLSSLQAVVHGAAPCSPEVKRAMIEWWGPVIYEYYGATESGIVVSNTSEDALKKPGTVGRPVEHATVKVLDDAGNELGPNEIGEIFVWFHGYTDFTYHKKDEQRREIDRGGLITCGDVGYIDEDGYVFLCDRKKDMVISGGVNIYPAEIEAVLITMPGVKDCAVFGIPDDEFGESLACHVEPVPGSGLAAEDVRAFLREHIAGYKVPKVIEIADSLPREDSGKIFKRRLREPYWEGRTTRI